MSFIWHDSALSCHENLAKYSPRFQEIEVSEHKRKMLLDHLTFLFTQSNQFILRKKENEIIEKITKKIMTCENDEFEKRVDVLFICLFIHVDENDCVLVPLIQFRNSIDSENTLIDHSGNVYQTWDDFKEHQRWKGYNICVPQQGLYDNGLHYGEKQSGENNGNSTKDIEIFKFGIADIKRDLLNTDNFITRLIELLDRFDCQEVNSYTKIFRISFYLSFFDEQTKEFVELLQRKFNDDKKQILTVLLKGFHEITGEPREYLGNAYFARNIFYILHHSDSLRRLTICEGNQLQIVTNQLTLHAKSLIQQDVKHLSNVFKKIKDTDKDKDLSFLGPLRESRLVLHCQRERQLRRIKETFAKARFYPENVKQIIQNLSPTDTDSLFRALLQACYKFNKLFVDCGLKFAELLKCRNIYELCAAFEYISLQLEKEKNIKELITTKDVTKKEKIEGEINLTFNHKIENFAGKFLALKVECEQLSTGHDLNFVTAMSAAYHFEKHVTKPKIDLTLAKYLEYARLVANHDVAFSWTQDGLSRCFNINLHGAQVIKYKHENKDKPVIATMMFKGNKLTEEFKKYIKENQ